MKEYCDGDALRTAEDRFVITVAPQKLIWPQGKVHPVPISLP